MTMYLVWDGFKSLLAAFMAVFLCGLPAAAVLHLIMGWPLPVWGIWPMGVAGGGLSLVGVVLTAAFLRKSWRGISPLRDRRR